MGVSGRTRRGYFSELLLEDLTLSSGGGATLQLLDLDSTSTPWTIDINNIRMGHGCTPASYSLGMDGGGAVLTEVLSRQEVTHPNVPTVGVEFDLTEIQSHGPIYLKVCRPFDAPVARNGAYLTALFLALSLRRARRVRRHQAVEPRCSRLGRLRPPVGLPADQRDPGRLAVVTEVPRRRGPRRAHPGAGGAVPSRKEVAPPEPGG